VRECVRECDGSCSGSSRPPSFQHMLTTTRVRCEMLRRSARRAARVRRRLVDCPSDCLVGFLKTPSSNPPKRNMTCVRDVITKAFGAKTLDCSDCQLHCRSSSNILSHTWSFPSQLATPQQDLQWISCRRRGDHQFLNLCNAGKRTFCTCCGATFPHIVVDKMVTNVQLRSPLKFGW
jgi:hypothetical protein